MLAMSVAIQFEWISQLDLKCTISHAKKIEEKVVMNLREGVGD